MAKYDCGMGHPLDMLGEEASEIIQEIFKAKRFGLDHVYEGGTPRQRIIQETGDFFAVVGILIKSGFFNEEELDKAMEIKNKRLTELFGYKE